MFLRSVETKNYRSLEDVKLDKLDRFNVLIGRNNSGKSSVFGALHLVNGVVNKHGAFDPQRVLTDMDLGRSLEVQLTFNLKQRDREEFFDLLLPTPELRSRQGVLRDSPMMRQVKYRFQAPVGNPYFLHLQDTKALAEDGQWTILQRVVGDGAVPNPTSQFLNMDTVRNRYSTYPLDSNMFNVNNASYFDSSLLLQIVSPYAYSDQATVWTWEKLSGYFRNAFFFDPFRHSVESAAAQQTLHLAQDGSNLAQALHTINSNDRHTFQEIERFVQAALPDVGVLQTPLEGAATRVSFRRPAGGYEVRLHDMGGGIEQLLMAATVLLTTGDDNTLFLEEPESHLHAGAQRFLMEQLYNGDRQIFVSTHSPTFINFLRSRSLYRVTYSNQRTKVERIKDAQALDSTLEDVGARNSDVLLSDAVLFVEGPSDRDVLRAWSETLGSSLAESNVTVLPMGGGEYAEGKARVRAEILEGISEKAPVPHLFVLDRDERSRDEIGKLQRDLGEKVEFLERRELENYLMVPRAILSAIRAKHRDDALIVAKLDNSSDNEVETLIQTSAESLYDIVLLKRIRTGLGGLKGGLLPREMVSGLSSRARRADLPRILRGKIKTRLNDHLDAVDVDQIVRFEREALDREWSDSEKHQQLAPGEEILAAVFHHLGSEYNKTRDAVRIARSMNADEIAPEIKTLLQKAASLPA